MKYLWIKASLTIAAACILTACNSGSNNSSNSGTTFAYVSDFNGNIDQCAIESTGALGACSVTPSTSIPGWNPYAPVTFNSSGGNTYAYVTDFNQSLYKCNVNNNNGTFSSCMVTGESATLWTPNGVTFSASGSVNYAYVADNNGYVQQCSITASSGALAACSATGTPESGWTPYAISFNTFAGVNYAYVASYDGITGNVYQCLVNGTSGTFSNCTVTPASGAPATWIPDSITFNTFNGNTYAYIADYNGNIYQCGVNPGSGALTTCSSTPAFGAPNWQPYNLVFNTSNGITYAYISDYGLSGVIGAGNIYQCLVNNSNGTLYSCSTTPAANTPLWNPTGITFINLPL